MASAFGSIRPIKKFLPPLSRRRRSKNYHNSPGCAMSSSPKSCICAIKIDIVRAELKEIDPPKDVQDTMNKIVKAENEKIAAIDFATAAETTADGVKRAAIKQAEGVRQARILQAQGEAEAIQLVNEAADKYFVGNSQLLKRLETAQYALQNNAKIIVPAGQQLVNVIGDLAGIMPHNGKADS